MRNEEPLLCQRRSLGRDLLDTVRDTVKNKHFRRGAIALAAAATLAYTSQAHAYSGSFGEDRVYDFVSGLWDGLLFPANLVMSLFSNSSFAADGSGIMSTPNTGFGYYFGFLLTFSSEGSGVSIAPRKKKDED